MRLTGAIVLETLAFSVWNIGTRSPAAVLRDVRARSRDRAAITAGALRTFIGVIFSLAGTILLLPAVANPEADFAAMEVFTLLVALGLEHLIGPDVRGLADTLRTP